MSGNVDEDIGDGDIVVAGNKVNPRPSLNPYSLLLSFAKGWRRMEGSGSEKK